MIRCLMRILRRRPTPLVAALRDWSAPAGVSSGVHTGLPSGRVLVWLRACCAGRAATFAADADPAVVLEELARLCREVIDERDWYHREEAAAAELGKAELRFLRGISAAVKGGAR